jgi:hypothetical protein
MLSQHALGRPYPNMANLQQRRLQYPLSSAIGLRRMMSDWKVELVDDNISEFYVEFNGPKDSASPTLFMQCCGVWRGSGSSVELYLGCILNTSPLCRSIRGGSLEGPCRAAGCVPLQVALHRLREPDLPPKRGRDVSLFMSQYLYDIRQYAPRQADTQSFCRAGSVCLDVINQTWSPMFGKHLCLALSYWLQRTGRSY